MNSNISFKSINIEGKTRKDIKAKIYKFDGPTSAIIDKVGMGYNVTIVNGKNDKYFFIDVLLKNVDGGSKVIINDSMNNNRPLHIQKIKNGGTVILKACNFIENNKNRTSDLVPPNIIVDKIAAGGTLNTLHSTQALIAYNLVGGTINTRHDSSIDVMNNQGHINLKGAPFESKQTVIVKNNFNQGTILVGDHKDETNKGSFVVRIFNHLGSIINNLSNDCMIDRLYPYSKIIVSGEKSSVDIRNTSRISDKPGYLSQNIQLLDGATLTDSTKQIFS